jgi:hypothetical protein
VGPVALLRRLIPLMLVAVLGVAGVLTLGHPWLAGVALGLYEGLTPPLVGVVNNTPLAPPTLANIEAGRTQTAAMVAFNTAIPQRAFMVRAFNDLLWRSIGASYMASGRLLTGAKRQLIDADFLRFYCGYNTFHGLGQNPLP